MVTRHTRRGWTTASCWTGYSTTLITGSKASTWVTNGKGSVSHLLAAILQEAGYRVGLYTSPHLLDFRERIKVNGRMIPEEYVVDFVDRYKALFEPVMPSFFELTMAMAFLYFAEQAVEVAVVEVGLGGRLDSTNIISPDLSVITNIGRDHVKILGNSLPEIAAEKAGIIKPRTPVVIGEAGDGDVERVFTERPTRSMLPSISRNESGRTSPRNETTSAGFSTPMDTHPSSAS